MHEFLPEFVSTWTKSSRSILKSMTKARHVEGAIQMEYRPLGRTGLAVSPVCLGTMGFGPPVRQEQIKELVQGALEMGINFIDTANCYDGPNRQEQVVGHAESYLGSLLADGLRDEFIIVTKACVPMRPGPNHKGLSASHLIRELDASLKRLRTDYVDVFMLHWPDPFSDATEVVRAVDMIIRSGRARAFGVSNHQAWEVCEFLWQGDVHHWASVGVSEISLSILDRCHENELPFYEKHKIGVIPLQPLKGGLLSGIYRRELRERKLNHEHDTQNIPGWSLNPDEATFDRLEALEKLSSSLGVSLAEFSLAWVLSQRAVTSVIVGARNLRELKSALQANEIRIPRELMQQVDTIAPGPEHPRNRLDRPEVG
jgi:aryl-alcohol dehydrogenase-like predicted oxidoreductase